MIKKVKITKSKEQFTYAVGDITRMEYEGEKGFKDWALLNGNLSSETWFVYPHGHGSHGDQLFNQDCVKSIYEKMREYNMGIISVNLRDNAWMCPKAADDLHYILEVVREKYRVKRFVFVGGSMGGASTLIYSVIHPEDVAAAIVLGAITDIGEYYNWCRTKAEGTVAMAIALAIENAYDGAPQTKPEVYVKHSVIANCEKLKMPLFTAHGDADTLMPVEQMRNLTLKMKHKQNFHYEEISDGDHGAPLKLMRSFEWVNKKIHLP